MEAPATKKCNCKKVEDNEQMKVSIAQKIKNRLKKFSSFHRNAVSHYCNNCANQGGACFGAYVCPDSVCTDAICVCAQSGDCELDGFPSLLCD